MSDLQFYDPEIYATIQDEIRRQREKIELIASENFVPRAVLQAMGSVLTNKYAEGYPGRRYYGGCEHVDVAENLARERIKQVFGAAFANVQPHAGAQANMAAYQALISPGDTVLGMSLAEGGHLTHGSPVNFSGKLYKFVAYGVSEAQGDRVDYDEVRRLALEYRPKLIVAGYSAYPRELDFARFRAIADEAGAYLMVDMAHFAGLSATGYYPNPVPHAHVTTSTTHKTLRGPRGGLILCNDEEIAKRIDSAVFPGIQGGPLMHVIAAKAVAFKQLLDPSFKAYCGQIVRNAAALAQALQRRGFTLVSGGTDNHLMLVNLAPLGLTGKKVQEVLDQVGITVNKNAVPRDPQKPMVTSGIRLGTPAVTTRGMVESDMETIADLIAAAVEGRKDDQALAAVAKGVLAFTSRFPLVAGEDG